ncbi:mismatch-specific DNA-glycosylase [SAR202 cluster bacterium AD-802-E10_MRT_200m]|nr:mismatch-specific DNA-glycosylase [SAR202 cluster bacterium AD-802-E10_MRT_200m]
MDTLPDYLTPELDLVFVGINPSIMSARLGHYYANPRNRFWRVFNACELAETHLSCEMDHQILGYNMGFTDLVKRPTRGVSDLTISDYRQGVQELKSKLEFYQPLLICFQGITAYRQYLHLIGKDSRVVALGKQTEKIGNSIVFVVPNPSPANARFNLSTLIDWSRKLKDLRDDLKQDT